MYKNKFVTARRALFARRGSLNTIFSQEIVIKTIFTLEGSNLVYIINLSYSINY